MSQPVMQGEVYRASGGHWSWRIFEDSIVVRSGAGYETEAEGYIEMLEEFALLTQFEESFR